jgi:membrane associated rhomboid family serine protease
MIFFPYKADVELQRWPVLTVLVAAACVWVFLQQTWSANTYSDALETYCSETTKRSIETIVRYLPADEARHPCLAMLRIHRARDSSAEIEKIAAESQAVPFFKTEEDGRRYLKSVLREQYSAFARRVPHDLSESLVYHPNEIDFGRMLTSVFSHGDWGHLIGNMVFFFAFAAAVEVIGGYLFFSGMIVALAVSTSLAYTWSVAGADDALPTLGLSGVVMGMIGFVSVVAPALGIRCFFWFLLFVRTFSVPALLLAAWYIGWDIYELNVRDEDSNVNYIAHVSGAAAGALVGGLFRFLRRDYLRDIAGIDGGFASFQASRAKR